MCACVCVCVCVCVCAVFTELFTTLWAQLFVWLRPMFKWLLHKVSGKCELLRITYEEQPGAKQTKRIGQFAVELVFSVVVIIVMPNSSG